ncbi:hypothetical protein AX17_007461 [Amanita inopinata Kibby_2008]|nr:hypothetical protein AX17_007461 [Amanita inopinata Kibby_2008]
MVDTFIANASIDDLRSITRRLLSTGPAGITPAFINAARARLVQTNAKAIPPQHSLFSKQLARDGNSNNNNSSSNGSNGNSNNNNNNNNSQSVSVPTPHLHDALTRARALFGAGMGFASLGILTAVVRATIGLRWNDQGDMADILAVVDGDITQAIQSCKEEAACGAIGDHAAARDAVNDLKAAIIDCQTDVESWGGEFPFDRASLSIEFWKLPL